MRQCTVSLLIPSASHPDPSSITTRVSKTTHHALHVCRRAMAARVRVRSITHTLRPTKHFMYILYSTDRVCGGCRRHERGVWRTAGVTDMHVQEAIAVKTDAAANCRQGTYAIRDAMLACVGGRFSPPSPRFPMLGHSARASESNARLQWQPSAGHSTRKQAARPTRFQLFHVVPHRCTP